MKKLVPALCAVLSVTLVLGQINLLGQNRRDGASAPERRPAAATRQDATGSPLTQSPETTGSDAAPFSVGDREAVAARKPVTGSSYTHVFSIPAGGQGIHYKGGRLPEIETSGPGSLRVAPDGSFLIADTVGDRILRFGRGGALINAVKVEGVQAVTDVVASGTDLFALDDVADEPAVHRLSAEGEALEKITLPERLRANGLSGLTVDDSGAVLAEARGGVATFDLYGAERKGKTLAGDSYAIQSDAGAGERKSGTVVKGRQRITVKVNHTLGGLSVLGRGASGDTFILVEELSDTHVLRVDQTVRRYGSDGTLLGLARVPLAERYTYVRNGVAVAPDGQVYALVTRPDRADVVRLRFSRSLTPILPGGAAAAHQLAEPPPFGTKAAPSAGEPAVALATACRSRDAIYNAAMGYVNNRTYLTATNISGACAGRGKPRYLGAANYYSSVSYDWGGYDTVADFNNFMSQGYKAGDIYTSSIEGCSRGVDCSGFLSRVWATSGRYTTLTLPNISTAITRSQLQRGDIINSAGSHVALFNRSDSQGVYTIEATVYNNYDRVVSIFNGWARFNGYRFYRYNNACGTTTPGQAWPVVTSSLRLSAGSAQVGDTLSAAFTIVNRGDQSITFTRLLAGGRMDGDPNCALGCPDFSPTGPLTLAPGQSYSYSGSRYFGRAGSYTYFVAYQKSDGSWVTNVATENGATATARLTVSAPPSLNSHYPSTVYAGGYDQTVYLYGERLANTSYVYVQFPGGGGGYIYPPGQIFYRSPNQLSCKITFGARGQYYLWAYTPEGGWSNARAIYVY